MSFRPKLIFFFALFALYLNFVEGHLAGGLDKQVNGYVVDLGYEPAVMKANEKTVIALSLLNASTSDIVDFDGLWVRIFSDEVVFAGTFKQEAGNAAFTFTFPEAGSYELTARFFDDEKMVVETDFAVEVGDDGDVNQFSYSSIIILALTILVLFLIFKRHMLKAKR
jgi:hypothetical protein